MKATGQVKFKNTLVFITIIFLAFSFPIQVYFKSPYPALIPYLIFFLHLIFHWRSRRNVSIKYKKTHIDTLIAAYVLLFLFNTGWQLIFGHISFQNGISAIIIYIFPLIFYQYFKGNASLEEIKSMLFAISLVGIVCGLFFIIDNYFKILFKEVSTFSEQAYVYAQIRAPDAELNDVRISGGYRSHGLLESAVVSCAWVAMGCFSALSLINIKFAARRICIFIFFAILIVFSLNFTSIFGFFVTIILTASQAPKKLLRLGIVIIILTGIIGIIMLDIWLMQVDIISPLIELVPYITLLAEQQLELASGRREFGGGTYFGNLFDQLISIPYELSVRNPLALVFGEGFSTHGVEKGGDHGIIDTIYRFGLLFSILLFYCFIKLIQHFLIKTSSSNMVYFSISTIIFTLLMEIHYSIWNAKSVLPLFFICLALISRDMNSLKVDLKHTPSKETL
jgi:hypothetical protein